MSGADESLYARELSGGFAALKFRQPLEREFRAHYLGQNATRLRTTLTLAVAFTLVLAVLDWRLAPIDIQAPSLLVRLAAVCPALLLALAATHPGYLARCLGWLVPVAAATSSAGALVLAWMSLEGSPALAMSTLVVTTVFVYLMLGLRLTAALWFVLPLLPGYMALGLVYELPAPRLGYELVGLMFLNVCGAYGCYRLEHASRTSFLEREIVNMLTGSDALTGIPNRRMFNAHLQRVWRQAMRESRGLAVAIMEVDHYRSYVGRHGRQAADTMLRRVAHAIMGCARRPLDFSARFSGEEFALVLYDPEQTYVEKLTGRIRDRIALLDIPHGGSPASERLTVSIGVATLPPGGKDDPKGLLELADMALTEVKRGGGNAVVVKDVSVESGRVLKGPWESAGP